MLLQVGVPARVAGALDLATETCKGHHRGAGATYVQWPAEKQWGCPTYETAQLMIITLLPVLLVRKRTCI